jgi:hypothetical protein
MSQSKSFKVPYAIDENESLTSPDTASKSSRYKCPGCGQLLIVRMGKVVRAHFSHPASAHCSFETALHKAAKLAIASSVQNWIATGEDRPVIQNRCFSCCSPHNQPLPDRVKAVEIETRLDSGHIADVVLTDGENAILAIEIVVTNAVSSEKGRQIPIYWIELDAQAVISDSIHWNPTQLSLKKFGCKRCHSEILRFRNECLALAKLSDVVIPDSGFLYGPTECERCNKWCIAFLWDKGACRPNATPRTVQLVQHSNDYIAWSNTCAWCQNIIMFSDLRQRHRPFWFMKAEEASTQNRSKSLAKIALHYFDEVRPRSFDKVAPPRKLWMLETENHSS